MGRPRKEWKPKIASSDRATSRVVGYCRVSTDEQVDGYGLAAQETAIRQYCEAAGYELVAVLTDEGLSGTLPPDKRPGLAAILEMAERHEIDGVVVRAADRLSRKLSLFLTLTETLEAANVSFFSVTQPEMSSKVARAIFGILAELERDGINSRTSSGRQQKAAQGKYTGGKVPYGYLLTGSRHNATWEISESEAATVKEIFERRAKGETFQSIANDLDNRGIPAPRGAKWSPTAVYRIATNEAYTGVRRWREGSEIKEKGDYQAIISPDMFRGDKAA
jgi:site-specific DNA recombinase